MRRLAMRWHGLDAQLEEGRAPYLGELAEALGMGQRVLDCLIQLVKAGKGHDPDLSQRLDLLVYFARKGSKEARDVLYSSGRTHADYIVDMDGLAGLTWLWEQYGETLTADEDSFEFSMWVSGARDIDGEAIDQWLAQNPRALELAQWEPNSPSRPDQAKSFEEFRSLYESDPKRFRGLSWGRSASEEDLRKAATELLIATDEGWMRTLGGALRRRPDLLDVPRLIARWREQPLELPSPWQYILSHATHPELRELGLELLERNVDAAVDLLDLNAMAEDVPALRKAVLEAKVDHEDIVHSIGMSLKSIARRIPEAEPLVAWIYENTPCSFCRGDAFGQLLEANLATTAMIQECLFDCDPGTRERALAAQRSSEA